MKKGYHTKSFSHAKESTNKLDLSTTSSKRNLSKRRPSGKKHFCLKSTSLNQNCDQVWNKVTCIIAKIITLKMHILSQCKIALYIGNKIRSASSTVKISKILQTVLQTTRTLLGKKGTDQYYSFQSEGSSKS